MTKGNVEIIADNNYIKKSLEIIVNNLKLTQLGKTILINSHEKNLFSEQEVQSLLQKKADVHIILCSQKNCNLINDINTNSHINTIDISLPLKKIERELDLGCNQRKQKTPKKTPKKTPWQLTFMERRIVSSYADQLPIALISRLENCSEKTISAHKRSAMKKMNVTTNQELIIKFNMSRKALSNGSWMFQ